MQDLGRLQVRSTDAELPWKDVGHDTSNQKLPVTIYDADGVSGLPEGSNKVGIVDTNQTNGVPNTHTKISSNGVVNFITKGQLNKIKVRPAILNEHAESSREIMDVVESGVIVGQIFKASQDNINGIGLTLESAAGSPLDDFESYADSAALQVEWVEGTNPALLETTIVKTGDKSMNLPLDVLADTWTDTVTSVDYTDFTFDLDFYQTVLFGLGGADVSFFVGDGTNTKSITLPVNEINSWEHFDININALSEDGGGTTDVTAITKIGFRVDRKRAGQDAYVDNLTATTPPGSVQIKLWDMGTTLPVGDGASFSLADATQYTTLGDVGLNGNTTFSEITLALQGGKRLYEVKTFAAGPALEMPSNVVLTPNNYYAITLHYVDTDVSVYGPDTTFSTDYYENGYAFSTVGEASGNKITTIPGAAGSGAFSDLMFLVYSTQDVYITTFVQRILTSTGAEATPGNANVNVFVEDSGMVVTDISTHGSGAIAEIEADHTLRPMYLEKGGKFEIYYSDDFSDDVAIIGLTMAYLYIPPTVNG